MTHKRIKIKFYWSDITRAFWVGVVVGFLLCAFLWVGYSHG